MAQQGDPLSQVVVSSRPSVATDYLEGGMEISLR